MHKRSSTLTNGAHIPTKPANKHHKHNKEKQKVKVFDPKESAGDQSPSPHKMRRNDYSPPGVKVTAFSKKEPQIMGDALKLNYAFNDLVVDQNQIMSGGHDVHKVAKIVKQRLKTN